MIDVAEREDLLPSVSGCFATLYYSGSQTRCICMMDQPCECKCKQADNKATTATADHAG